VGKEGRLRRIRQSAQSWTTSRNSSETSEWCLVCFAVSELGEEGREAGDDAWGSQDDGCGGEENDREQQQEHNLPNWGCRRRQGERWKRCVGPKSTSRTAGFKCKTVEEEQPNCGEAGAGSDRSEVVRQLESRRVRATVCQSEGCPVKELSVLSKRNRD